MNRTPAAKRSLAILIALSACCSLATTQGQESSANKRTLKTELAGFAKFEGTWIFDGKWKDGNAMWAKNDYTIGMNGNFFEAKTFTKNEHGKEYQRYHTIWRYDPEKAKVESYGFTYDGTVTITDSKVDVSDQAHPTIHSQWRSAPDKPIIKQEVRLIDDKSYGWKVWSSQDGKEWTELMDGVWKKKAS